MYDTFGGNGYTGATESAGTRIQFVVPPKLRGYTRITKLTYAAAATAHTLTACRPIGKTTTSAASSATATVINLNADPGPSGNALAANDLLAVRETDGVTRLYKVSSLATLSITLTAGLTAGVAEGASVWNFGTPTDTDPTTGRAHPTLAAAASPTTVSQEDREAGVWASHEADSPILLDSNNATNAGTFTQISWTYTPR